MSLLVFCVVVIPQVYAQTRTKMKSCSNISEKFLKYAYDLRFCPVLKRQKPRTEEGNGARLDGARAADAHTMATSTAPWMSLDFRFNRQQNTNAQTVHPTNHSQRNRNNMINHAITFNYGLRQH